MKPDEFVLTKQDSGEYSLVERLATGPKELREEFLASLSPLELNAFQYRWDAWARPKQMLPPGSWSTWLVQAGRGFGKTRVGAEVVREKARTKQWKRIALVGATAADVRDTMIEGESGILAISPPSERPKYEPSKRRLTWPNGVIATCFSADEPNRLRGPQHDGAWADEVAAWRYADAWDQLQFGLRLGNEPQAVATTTPRPIPLIRELITDPSTRITHGSMYENSRNLAERFLKKMMARYEGTRLARQELWAEMLNDTPGALWTLALIEKKRIRSAPQLLRTVVAVDPSVSSTGDGDECGVVAAGVAMCSCRGHSELHGFVLGDVSEQLTPGGWAKRVVTAYDTYGADRVVAEVNNGGGLVEVNIRTEQKNIPYKAVHAAKGKRTRAEPIAALYEQGKIHHVGAFAKLEDELTTWSPLDSTESPNRLDALVWAFTDLMLVEEDEPGVVIVDGVAYR